MLLALGDESPARIVDTKRGLGFHPPEIKLISAPVLITGNRYAASPCLVLTWSFIVLMNNAEFDHLTPRKRLFQNWQTIINTPGCGFVRLRVLCNKPSQQAIGRIVPSKIKMIEVKRESTAFRVAVAEVCESSRNKSSVTSPLRAPRLPVSTTVLALLLRLRTLVSNRLHKDAKSVIVFLSSPDSSRQPDTFCSNQPIGIISKSRSRF